MTLQDSPVFCIRYEKSYDMSGFIIFGLTLQDSIHPTHLGGYLQKATLDMTLNCIIIDHKKSHQ